MPRSVIVRGNEVGFVFAVRSVTTEGIAQGALLVTILSLLSFELDCSEVPEAGVESAQARTRFASIRLSPLKIVNWKRPF
jgi:hypothetical protein